MYVSFSSWEIYNLLGWLENQPIPVACQHLFHLHILSHILNNPQRGSEPGWRCSCLSAQQQSIPVISALKSTIISDIQLVGVFLASHAVLECILNNWL